MDAASLPQSSVPRTHVSSIEWTRTSTMMFIDALKQHPCLWQIKSAQYKDRGLRFAALKNIVAIMRQSIYDIEVDDVRKKINTLRTQFRREYKNVIDMRNANDGSEDAYIPKLWCYDNLLFLVEGEVSRHSTANLDDCNFLEDAVSDEIVMIMDEARMKTSPPPPPASHCSGSPSPTQEGPKRKLKTSDQQDAIIRFAFEKLTRMEAQEEEFSPHGKIVTKELQKMDKETQRIAWKLINDVLFLGGMGVLRPTASVKNGD
ncbi:uncharacterized protein LOC108681840 [Hyalella azteca]|uniref:Uncharacterized protein LOC108681840 n=1 Tax=Hyalella azteca TaxID=294128 RepID=A0A8B7PK94_HYAAZ|nr:uncharacterized protein LOC108681840 [Hyalella azteca]